MVLVKVLMTNPAMASVSQMLTCQYLAKKVLPSDTVLAEPFNIEVWGLVVASGAMFVLLMKLVSGCSLLEKSFEVISSLITAYPVAALPSQQRYGTSIFLHGLLFL